MCTKFDAPDLDNVMETVWMQLFHGNTLCFHEVKRAIPGTRWPMVWWQPALSRKTRVIIEKVEGDKYKMYDETMGKMETLDPKGFSSGSNIVS